MAIVTWPDDVELKQEVLCVACRQEVSLQNATAGGWDAEGRQAFACNSHFLNAPRLIRGWIDFHTEQRRVLRQRVAGRFCLKKGQKGGVGLH